MNKRNKIILISLLLVAVVFGAMKYFQVGFFQSDARYMKTRP